MKNWKLKKWPPPINMGLGIGTGLGGTMIFLPVAGTILLETGDKFLMESAGVILLEG